VLALALLCSEPTATIERNPLEKEAHREAGAGPTPEVKFGIEVAEQGMWREALFRFEKAVEIDPQNPSALNNLAVALEQMGQFQEARESYERALELRPDDLYIQQNYDLFREADDKRNRKKRRRRR
jgi:Flp pilus assembly protein TadD